MKVRQIKPAQRKRKSKSKGHRLNHWKRAHGRCWYCGKSIGKKNFILEHQEPFSRGGADSSRNLVVSCADCDREKGGRNVDEYRALKCKRLELETLVFYGER